MDIMKRIQRLPKELRDEIFQFTVLAELPYGEKETWEWEDASPEPISVRSMVKVTYTRPVPRPQTTLSCLFSYMDEILQVNKRRGLEYAQATFCIVRLFEMFDLFKHAPQCFFESHLKLQADHDGVLEVSGIKRLHMLQVQCQNAFERWPIFAPNCYCNSCWNFEADVEDYGKLCFENVPNFLLQTVHALRSGRDGFSLLPGYYPRDRYFEVQDGKVQALFIWEYSGVPHTWLSRVGEPWVQAQVTATVKAYDKDGRGGIMEWELEDGHYELEFSNVFNANLSIDYYLCTFDEAGIRKANEARNDADYARQEKKERRRSKTVAAMSKAERAGRNAREGRFWCLG